MNAAPEVLGSSYRDPRAFVFVRDGVLLRQVNEAHRRDFEGFLGSGLYEALVGQGLLIPHDEVDLELAASPGAYKVLRPEVVPFVSYPYEWCFSQLRDAALTTLRVQEVSMSHGMSLRDASAFNVTYRRGAPVFIDTASFEPLVEGRPWVAYRQFCEHFLAPLALMAYRDPRLGQLLRIHLDGVPLDLAAELLPRSATARPSLLLHLRLHAKSQRKHGRDGVDPQDQDRAKLSSKAFQGLVESLRGAVTKLPEPRSDTTWAAYYDEASHYSDEASAAKEALVATALSEAAPSTVWDLGANTGRFARLASSRGIDTLALDLDQSPVEAAYRDARARGDEHLLPLVMDLANPSPAAGWANRERMTLEERGPADLVLALALIHHLAIGRNVPLDRVVAHLSRLGRWALVEWIPKQDPRVRELLASREDVFDDYTEEAFEAAARSVFRVVRRDPIPGTDRILFLLQR
ncbi:MAG TPA: SAM-dependent methyltransferase [Actinomycetota bacterium]